MLTPFDSATDALIVPLGRRLEDPQGSCSRMRTAAEGYELRFPGSEPELYETQDAAVARYQRRIARREEAPRLFWQGPRESRPPVHVEDPRSLRNRYEVDQARRVRDHHGVPSPC